MKVKVATYMNTVAMSKFEHLIHNSSGLVARIRWNIYEPFLIAIKLNVTNIEKVISTSENCSREPVNTWYPAGEHTGSCVIIIALVVINIRKCDISSICEKMEVVGAER